MSQNKITMSEIARLAGVAESTVSRALAGSNRISDGTREKIQKIVEESGYSINARARALRTNRSRTIEVVIPDNDRQNQSFSDPFFSQLMSSIADALADKGYDLLLSRIPPWSDSPNGDAIAAGRADGVIVFGQGEKPGRLADYARQGNPIVVWGANLPDIPYYTVGSDNYLGGQLVGQHFSKLGRQRVAFFGDINHPEIKQRHDGCTDALGERKGDQNKVMTLSMPFDAESAYQATLKIINDGLWHDAIFAASDVIAIATMQALQDNGVKIPEDVAVVGYDNISISTFTSPGLTTVSQNTDRGGFVLVDTIISLLEGKTVSSTILPTNLIERRSCGAEKQ